MENQKPLPTSELFWNCCEICQIDGFWYMAKGMDRMAEFRSGFEPKKDDILLTSFTKTGTTWLMALCYNILDVEEGGDLLATKNPHEVVPTLENDFLVDRVQEMLLNCSPPRLLHTHLPCSYLPEKVRESGCKLVYVARNPKDTLVSMWHFYNKNFVKVDPTAAASPFPLEGAVESFCSGAVPWGPFYEHVVGYWEESKKRPDEVFFVKYEDLCRDLEEQVRKLATFLGQKIMDPDVEEVLWRSSLNRLKELEVNKNGVRKELPYIPNFTYFRTGTVGDWKNYLTSDMAQRIDQLTRVKLEGTGLSFDDE
ncbi:unnamed protein product [Linum trigynum]